MASKSLAANLVRDRGKSVANHSNGLIMIYKNNANGNMVGIMLTQIYRRQKFTEFVSNQKHTRKNAIIIGFVATSTPK